MHSGPYHYSQANHLAEQAHHFTYGDGADPVAGNALAGEAVAHAINAQTAALVMIAEILDHMAGGGGHIELKAWRDVIPMRK
jgi:hypothetical protein